MKRIPLLIGLILALTSPYLLGAMSDAKAALEVFKLWGSGGFIGVKPRVRLDSNWTRQIGFLTPGCEDPYRVVGEGFNTWDAAFASLPADKGIQGTFSGMRSVLIDVNTNNMTVPASLQVMIDGMPYGTPVIITSQMPVSQMVDTRLMTDGFHVVCGLLSYVDATSTKVLRTNQKSSMFIVKQVTSAGNSGPAPMNAIVHLGLEGWPPPVN